MQSPLQIKAEDMIDVLTLQRNAAMDEVARQGAIIKTLQKMLEEGGKQAVIPFPNSTEGETNEGSNAGPNRATG